MSSYQLKNPSNGVYVFVISGQVAIDNNVLASRDGLGIWDTESFTMDVPAAATVLVMEVPLFL